MNYINRETSISGWAGHPQVVSLLYTTHELHQSGYFDLWREVHIVHIAGPEELFHHFCDGIK